jgi:hypothetical protein
MSGSPELRSDVAPQRAVGSWTDHAVRRLLDGLSRRELTQSLELRQSAVRLRMIVWFLLFLLVAAVAAAIPLTGAAGRLAHTLRTLKEYGGELTAFIFVNLVYVRLREDGLLLVAGVEAILVLWIAHILPRLRPIIRSITFSSEEVALIIDENGVEDRRKSGIKVSWDDLIAVASSGVFLTWVVLISAPPRRFEGTGRRSWRGRRRLIFATPLDMPRQKLTRILRIRHFAHEHQRLAVALAAMSDSQPCGLAAMSAPPDKQR